MHDACTLATEPAITVGSKRREQRGAYYSRLTTLSFPLIPFIYTSSTLRDTWTSTLDIWQLNECTPPRSLKAAGTI
jgi:hypothetical protein